MKKVFLTITLAIATIALFAQKTETMYIWKGGVTVYERSVSEIDSITFCKPTPPADPLYDEGVVINGVKWATRNVDAIGTFAATPESAGKFYQWNRKVAWNATASGICEEIPDWNVTIPGGTEWTSTNDPSPVGWRVPTIEELRTLLDTKKVSHEWVVQNCVTGRKFTDKASGASLFLPAAGYRYEDTGTLDHVGARGFYWSSSIGDWGDGVACILDVQYSRVYWYYSYRRYGFSVRSVADVAE